MKERKTSAFQESQAVEGDQSVGMGMCQVGAQGRSGGNGDASLFTVFPGSSPGFFIFYFFCCPIPVIGLPLFILFFWSINFGAGNLLGLRHPPLQFRPATRA